MRRPERSLVQESEEPSGPSHGGSEGLDSAAEFAVRRDQRHMTPGIGRDRHERFVAAAGGVHDGDTTRLALLGSASSIPFEHHDDGFGQPTRLYRTPHPIHQ